MTARRVRPQWTVQPDDPALYRSILTVSLTPSEPGTGTPEVPAAILLPLAALLLCGSAVGYSAAPAASLPGLNQPGEAHGAPGRLNHGRR